jgi:hypothetical protein
MFEVPACSHPIKSGWRSFALMKLSTPEEEVTNIDKELFNLALLEQLITLRSPEIYKTVKPLNDLIQSRPTFLSDHARWELLGLPALT